MRLSIAACLLMTGALLGIFAGILPEHNMSPLLWVTLATSAWLLNRRKHFFVFEWTISLALGLLLTEAAVCVYRISPRYTESHATYLRSIEYREEDSLLRTRLKPSAEVAAGKRFGEDNYAYRNVVYHIDDHARRVTSGSSEATDAPRHALFLGCSFTFGMGVVDQDTMPSRFQQQAGDAYQVYNVSEEGYGPGQILLLLRDGAPFDDIPQEHGFALYSFIADHLNRCTTYSFPQFLKMKRSPLFSLAEDGALEGPVRFIDSPALVRLDNRVAWLSSFSPLSRTAISRVNIPCMRAETAVEIAAKVLIACRKEYQKHFSGPFYALIWPRMDVDIPALPRFLQLLDQGGIQVLRVPPMPDASAAMIHPRDSHPSAAEYTWVADHLWDILGSPPPTPTEPQYPR